MGVTSSNRVPRTTKLRGAGEIRLPIKSVIELTADMAQLVEHHLAKVRVAGSNPVVRSMPMKVDIITIGLFL